MATAAPPRAPDCRAAAERILGMDIKGHTVYTLWVEKGVDSIKQEFYTSFTLDRSAKLDLGMLSAQGGIHIEENPESIKTIHINPVEGLSEDTATAWAKDAGIPDEAVAGVADIVTKPKPSTNVVFQQGHPHKSLCS